MSATAVEGTGRTAGEAAVNIVTSETMRTIVGKEPLFETFLQYKGFPFTVENPITEIVTFDDVAELQRLDKEAFIGEYIEWKAARA